MTRKDQRAEFAADLVEILHVAVHMDDLLAGRPIPTIDDCAEHNGIDLDALQLAFNATQDRLRADPALQEANHFATLRYARIVKENALRRQGQSMKTFVNLYFHEGSGAAVESNATEPSEFIQHFTPQFARVCQSDRYGLTEPTALNDWMEQAFDILAKLRGYKSEVYEERLLIAGQPRPNPAELVTIEETTSATV